MLVLKFCILYAKYYIYIQYLFNNNMLDLYACLIQLKQALKNRRKYMLYKIKKKNISSNSTLFIIIYETTMEAIHVIMYV